MSNSISKLDSHALIQVILQAVDPAQAVQRHVTLHGAVLRVDSREYDLTDKDIRLIAVGKAAVPMAQAVQDLLGARIGRGVVVTKYGHAGSQESKVTSQKWLMVNSQWSMTNDQWSIIEAAHPIPDENSLRAGELICEVLRDCTENTRVIVCVSGGASALVVAPQPGISLKTLQAINDALLRSGADIREMNAVRSRLDRLKAGGLVRMAKPAQVIGLILSDVIGDPLEVIASGITNEPGAHNVLVGNNTQACQAAVTALEAQGYRARIVTTEMRGEARERGADIAQAIFNEPSGTALVYGGETTVTIRGNGKGGRCQELALAFAMGQTAYPEPAEGSNVKRQTSGLRTEHSALILALGTDGTDGPTDAAGAIADGTTIARAAALGLDAQTYLEDNDSYAFFAALDDHIKIGPTGTNVADVVVAVRGK